MLVCEQCGGTVQLDTDSFEVNIEQDIDNADELSSFEMSAQVIGHCGSCERQHTYAIQGHADVVCK